jgi:hypothetical protein
MFTAQRRVDFLACSRVWSALSNLQECPKPKILEGFHGSIAWISGLGFPATLSFPGVLPLYVEPVYGII